MGGLRRGLIALIFGGTPLGLVGCRSAEARQYDANPTSENDERAVQAHEARSELIRPLVGKYAGPEGPASF